MVGAMEAGDGEISHLRAVHDTPYIIGLEFVAADDVYKVGPWSY